MDKRSKAINWWVDQPFELQKAIPAASGRTLELLYDQFHLSTGLQKEVTGCIDCPFLNGEWMNCQHQNRPSDPHIYWDFEGGTNVYITPDWCPLKKEPITISFKQ